MVHRLRSLLVVLMIARLRWLTLRIPQSIGAERCHVVRVVERALLAEFVRVVVACAEIAVRRHLRAEIVMVVGSMFLQ